MILNEQNYFSKEANQEYLSTSQYKDFCGSKGLLGCEAMAMAKITGKWICEPTPAMVMSSYVDAHFSRRLHIFKAKHPEVFTKEGSLKKAFKDAEKIINRIESDDYFMRYMSGKKQVIMTAEFLGTKWKSMVDSFIEGIAIVDLKVMADLRKAFWVKDYGYCSFVEYYGYDLQAAIYQKVEQENRPNQMPLPFYIAGASKEKVTDIDIIGIDQATIKNAYIEIEGNISRILKLKSGEILPDKCNRCDYCRSVKVLSKPIHFSELGSKL